MGQTIDEMLYCHHQRHLKSPCHFSMHLSSLPLACYPPCSKPPGRGGPGPGPVS